jgi:hypothetical protein
LNGNITILGFSGSDILKIEEICLILTKRYIKDITPLRFTICNGLSSWYRNDIKRSIDAPDEFTDVSQWHFVFTTPKEINSYYDSLNLKGKLDRNAPWFIL